VNKLAEALGLNEASSAPAMGRWAVPSGRVLAAWNLFVWGGRIRNLLAEPGGLAEANRWSLVGSITFCLLALVVLGLAFGPRRRRWSSEGGGHRERVVAGVMAALGVVVWTYRGVAIAGAGYSVGFVAVHTVLALVTVGLGLIVLAPARARER
jgi:hypothetical protein